MDIDEGNVGFDRIGHGLGFGRRRRPADDAVAGLLDEAFQFHCQQGFVLDDQDLERLGHEKLPF